jgi:Hypothetical protein (DUF2513)
MKRDMELIRELMLAIESRDDTEYSAEKLKINGGKDITQIKYHLRLLADAGFIKVTITNEDCDDGIGIMIDRMLHNGHEFLDNARNESVWKNTMKQVMGKGEGISIALLTQLLIAATKQHFGIG